MRDCLLAADLVICVSENTGRDVQKFFGIVESKIRVVPNACNCIFRRLSATEFRQPPPTQRPFLLYVGNRYAYKNFDILLDAYGCWRQNADIDLVVVGPSVWTPDELVKLNRAGLGDRVKILTGIEDGHLVELYNRAHASVLPSLYEGFGIPLLEAMACGCPIVASRIPTTVEVAGDCPIYFEPSDRDSLTHALDEALAAGRESSRCLMGLGRAKLYSWSNTAKQTLAVYRELNLRSMAKESDQLFA